MNIIQNPARNGIVFQSLGIPLSQVLLSKIIVFFSTVKPIKSESLVTRERVRFREASVSAVTVLCHFCRKNYFLCKKHISVIDNFPVFMEFTLYVMILKPVLSFPVSVSPFPIPAFCACRPDNT